MSTKQEWDVSRWSMKIIVDIYQNQMCDKSKQANKKETVCWFYFFATRPFFIEEINVGIDIQKRSTAVQYKEKRRRLLTLDLHIWRFGERHGGNKLLIKSGNSRCENIDSIVMRCHGWASFSSWLNKLRYYREKHRGTESMKNLQKGESTFTLQRRISLSSLSWPKA